MKADDDVHLVTGSEGEETETDDIQAVTTPENEETDDEMNEVSNVAEGAFPSLNNRAAQATYPHKLHSGVLRSS
ncbi:hypothetical protein DPV78_003965 [Talaromyces pinophilus]|nr:hypothetical protein DPV78_003965 [Talaromyces pinophilus]